MAKKSILLRSKKKKARELLEQGLLKEAQAICEKIGKVDRRDAEIWFMRGVIHSKLGEYSEASACLQSSCSIVPGNAAAQYNLGHVLLRAGQPDRAEQALTTVLKLDPNHRQAMSVLPRVLASLGKVQAAVDAYATATSRFGQDYKMCADMAVAFQEFGHIGEGVRWLQEAIAINPNINALHGRLANAYSQQWRHDDAEQSFQRAFEIETSDRKLYSDWLLHQHYHIKLEHDDLLRAHEGWPGNKSYVKRRVDYANDKTAQRPLRVGYLSADFREHSVAYFIERLICGHNRDQVEVFCYSDVPMPDAMTEHLAANADHWREIARSTETDVAKLIEADRIDILVELAGHTYPRILSVMDLQAAPVQVTYLGYPDTTGLASIDYRMTDGIADPVDNDSYCSEQLERIDNCFLCYQPPAEAPEIAVPPVKANGYVTFGSFNNLAKLNQEVVETWAGLLAKIENSRLFLKNPSLDDISTRSRVAEQFAAYGVTGERLILKGREATTVQHLARYAEVDICLDTFPYNGTTTTCEALWMGVPVVVLAGDRHSARVGKTLMMAAGLGDRVAESTGAYIEIAATLANDHASLTQLRLGQRAQVCESILCNGERFVASVEKVYGKIWQTWIE